MSLIRTVTRTLKRVIAVSLVGLIVAPEIASAQNRRLQTKPTYGASRTWDEMTAAEHTAAKEAAKKKKIDVLRVCADPGNLPLSDINKNGYQNKIAQILADKLGARLSYFWRPYLERGLTRETFDNNECDFLLDMPSDYQGLLTTEPIYRTTYVFASRTKDKIKIENFDDPQLQKLRIGTFQHSGIREVLSRHGVTGVAIYVVTSDADLRPENQPWRQVMDVANGELDLAGVWGPFAGYVKTKLGKDITIQPANLMEDQVKLEFDLSIGMRQNDAILKYALDAALYEIREDIEKVLREYGVPLVACSKCVVQGDLPSHGTYYDRFTEKLKERYLESSEPDARVYGNYKNAYPDQAVTEERVDQWLADGSNLTEELSNATTSNDHNRIRFIVKKGADVNALSLAGTAPIHLAASTRDDATIRLLIELGADVKLKDSDGWTPLHHATYRNHVPSVELLVKNGAGIETKTPNKLTPLAIALGEGAFYAAEALIKLGASPDGRFGNEDITPLMVLATQKPATFSERRLVKGPSVLAIAKALLDKGADVNAASAQDVTPLMIAAGHDNPQMIAQLIRAGADPHLMSKEGRTALDYAKKGQFARAIKALERLTKPKKASVSN